MRNTSLPFPWRRRVLRGLVLVAATQLAACANFTEAISIRKALDAGNANAYSVGAKQRMVMSNPQPFDPSDPGPAMRLCTEPSPDVFSALATSFSADASGSQKAADLGLALKLAGGINEGAATIERTQTLNMLREAMYRTCERYMNGGIGPEALVVQAARDQRMAVSILAIEQLTGVARVQATALVGTAKASLDGSPARLWDKAKDALDDSRKRRQAAQTSLKGLVQAFKLDLSDLGTCTGAADAQNEADTAKFNSACAEYLSAVRLEQENQAHYDKLGSSLGSGGLASSVDTSVSLITQAGTSRLTADSALIEAVKFIVERNHDFPEALMFCIARLARKGHAQADAVAQPCLDLVTTSIQKKEAVLKQEAAQSNEQAALSQLRQAGPWAVVFGADKDLQGAQHEIERARREWKLIDPRIFLKQGNYRSVSVATDFGQAQSMLKIAQAVVPNRLPHLVNLQQWCPAGWREREDKQVWMCE